MARYSILLFLLVFFTGIWIPRLKYVSEKSRLSEEILISDGFRRQKVSGEAMEELRKIEAPGETLAVYWLESGFGQESFSLTAEKTAAARKRWERAKGWGTYLSACQAVWDDLEYFPVAGSADGKGLTVSFEDSWMFDRSYGGERGHEGTDIMPSVNEPGVFPVVSMTDGIVESKGWLELGGWRLGIRAPHGAYFYYAHLDSYSDIREGDHIEAGEFLGFMGDTGYGTEEGTRGKFPVHLHVGIYLYEGGQEISVNPYPALLYVEGQKISGNFG